MRIREELLYSPRGVSRRISTDLELQTVHSADAPGKEGQLLRKKGTAFVSAAPPALRPREHRASPALRTPRADSPQTTRRPGLHRTDPSRRHKRSVAEAAGFDCCARRSPRNAPCPHQS